MVLWKLSQSLSEKALMIPARIKTKSSGEHFYRRQPTSSTDVLCTQVLTTSGKVHLSHQKIFLWVIIFHVLNQNPRKGSTPDIFLEVPKIERMNSGNAGWDTSHQVCYHETSGSEQESAVNSDCGGCPAEMFKTCTDLDNCSYGRLETRLQTLLIMSARPKWIY